MPSPAAAEGGGEGEQNGSDRQELQVPNEVPTATPAKKIQGDGEGPSPSKDEPPTVERALVEYAKHHGLEPSEVTEEMVTKSPEGLEGWACFGLNVNAHSPLGNSLYRAFKKDPKAAEAYRWLFDDLKKRFRQSWAMVRNFETIMHKRVHVIETVTKQEEIGTWKNELQLQQHLEVLTSRKPFDKPAATFPTASSLRTGLGLFSIYWGFVVQFLTIRKKPTCNISTHINILVEKTNLPGSLCEVEQMDRSLELPPSGEVGQQV